MDDPQSLERGVLRVGRIDDRGVTGAPSRWTQLANYFYQGVTIDNPNDYIGGLGVACPF